METTKMKDQAFTPGRKMSMPLRIKGDWNTIKGKLKQKFAQLTDIDLMFVQGKEEELVGRIQRALGKGHDEVVGIIQSFDQPTNEPTMKERESKDRPMKSAGTDLSNPSDFDATTKPDEEPENDDPSGEFNTPTPEP